MLQVPPNMAERRSPSDMSQSGSRPGTPGSASTKEALANFVNTRRQVIVAAGCNISERKICIGSHRSCHLIKSFILQF